MRNSTPFGSPHGGANVLDDPRGIRRDRRKAREIPVLPAAHAPPRAVGIERVSSERRRGVTHRTRGDPYDIRFAVKHCGRLRWGKSVNHKDKNLRNAIRRRGNALSRPIAYGRNAALLTSRSFSRALLASSDSFLRCSDSRRGASIASNLTASRIAVRARVLNGLEIRMS